MYKFHELSLYEQDCLKQIGCNSKTFNALAERSLKQANNEAANLLLEAKKIMAHDFDSLNCHHNKSSYVRPITDEDDLDLEIIQNMLAFRERT